MQSGRPGGGVDLARLLDGHVSPDGSLCSQISFSPHIKGRWKSQIMNSPPSDGRMTAFSKRSVIRIIPSVLPLTPKDMGNFSSTAWFQKSCIPSISQAE